MEETTQPVVNRWSELQRSKTLASVYRLKWDRSLAYIKGDQFGALGITTEDLAAVDSSRPRRRLVINHMLGIYRHVTSRLVTDYPSMASLPATDSPDDVAKAQADEQVLRYFWQQGDMRKTLRKAIQWLTATGTVALRTRYNTKKQVVEVQEIKPHDLRFEPYCNDPDDSHWIAVCQYVRMEDIIAQYPEHAEQLKEHAQVAARTYAIGPQSIPDNRYELYDVYDRDGKHEVWAGGIKLFETTTPSNRLPVRIMRYTEVEGYLWGIGLIEPLLDSQDQYNDTRMQIRRNIRLTGNPKVIIPEEGEIREDAFSDKPGEKIKVKNGANPSFMAPPSLPPQVMEEPARIMSEIYDQASIHGTALGKRNVGITSKVAIDATTQNDVQQLQLTMDIIEDAVKETAMDVLCYIKAFYKESKMVRMLDTNGTLVWAELDATRLTEDPEIFLEAGSLFRSEAQDRDQRTMQALEMGLITPEKAKDLLNQRLEPMRLLDQLAGLHHAQQVLESLVNLPPNVLKGVTFYPTDDLTSMEKVFRKFMQAPEFYNLPPFNQQQIDMAYQQILDLLRQKSGGMPTQKLQAPPGAPQEGQGVVGLGAPEIMPGMEQAASANDMMEVQADVPATE